MFVLFSRYISVCDACALQHAGVCHRWIRSCHSASWHSAWMCLSLNLTWVSVHVCSVHATPGEGRGRHCADACLSLRTVFEKTQLPHNKIERVVRFAGYRTTFVSRRALLCGYGLLPRFFDGCTSVCNAARGRLRIGALEITLCLLKYKLVSSAAILSLPVHVA